MLVFVESPLFSRLVRDYMDEAELLRLQVELMEYPETGDIIPRSGGIRKMRWAATGRGKRGGLRIIYYWQKTEDEIWLLTLYAKNEEENIPAHILRKIIAEFE